MSKRVNQENSFSYVSNRECVRPLPQLSSTLEQCWWMHLSLQSKN